MASSLSFKSGTPDLITPDPTALAVLRKLVADYGFYGRIGLAGGFSRSLFGDAHQIVTCGYGEKLHQVLQRWTSDCCCLLNPVDTKMEDYIVRISIFRAMAMVVEENKDKASSPKEAEEVNILAANLFHRMAQINQTRHEVDALIKSHPHFYHTAQAMNYAIGLNQCNVKGQGAESLRLSPPVDPIDFEILISHLAMAPFMATQRVNLFLFHLSSLTDEQVNQLLTVAPGIESLTCRNLELSEASWKKIAALPNLKSIEFTISSDDTVLPPFHLFRCALKLNSELSFDQILAIARVGNFRNFTKVNLYSFPVSKPSDDQMEEFSRYSPNLQEFSMVNADRLTSASLKHLFTYCEQLTKLSLNDCQMLNFPNFAAFASTYSGLTQLSLYGASSLRHTEIQELANCCPRLDFLELVGTTIGDKAVEVIANCCSELKHLSLERSTALTNDSLDLISAGLPKLRVLKLSGCGYITQNKINSLREARPDLLVIKID